MKCLFVGGIADGRKLELQEWVKTIPVARPQNFLPVMSESVTCEAIKLDYYKKHKFFADGEEFFFFALDGMTDADIMKALITKYGDR